MLSAYQFNQEWPQAAENAGDMQCAKTDGKRDVIKQNVPTTDTYFGREPSNERNVVIISKLNWGSQACGNQHTFNNITEKGLLI